MLEMPAPQQEDHSPAPRLGGGYLDDEAYDYATGKLRPSQPRNPVLSAHHAMGENVLPCRPG